jgi:hypothetical protein
MKKILFFLFFISGIFSETESVAQTGNDTINQGGSVVIRKDHSPRKAAIMSAILPGLGQAYNKKYWKMPIIYAGAGAVTYFFFYNRRYYLRFQDAYVAVTDTSSSTVAPQEIFDINTSNYEVNDFLTQRDFYRRNMELNVILGALLYTLNVIDAYVDAHLKYFDVNEDLALRIKPEMRMNHYRQLMPGVTINLISKR